jgi:antitoxin (DNA-binding transcriptional repressor) of toxin-antitoxin stability system
MNESFNIHFANSNLSKLLKLVEEGKTVTISRAGKSVADLVLSQKRSRSRLSEFTRQTGWVSDGFDEPLPMLWSGLDADKA